MAIVRNWEVLIARGITSSKKTEIILPPTPPQYEESKRFAWIDSFIWTKVEVEVNPSYGS